MTNTLSPKEEHTSHRRALVLFSGGQDSTTCLAWALNTFEYVETIGFSYGQRHRVELDVRPEILNDLRSHSSIWQSRLGQDHMVDLSFLSQLSQTAMTSNMEISLMDNGLPNTFVPGRNIVFLTSAAIVAYRRELNVLVTGVCETDFSGYPDCRDNSIKALQVALNLGMDTHLNLQTPLMWKNKAQTWSFAKQIGGIELVNLIINKTHTCYIGQRTVRHPWGYGCGQCPACQLRKRGWEEFIASQS